MSKNQINFSKMSNEAMAQLRTFKDCAVKVANEDLRYKAEIKPLKAELEKILELRHTASEEGKLSDEEITRKYSRVKVDNAIRKAETEHKAIVEPLNKSMRDTYVFIPENMYESYKKKIEEHKRGIFLDAIKTFLENLGIKNCSQAQVSKLAENMSDMFGARYAQSKKIVENNTLTTTTSKAQFNKLFMAVFCDMYVK